MFDTDAAFDLLPAEPSRVPVVDQVAGGLVGDLDWLPTGIMLAAALDRVDRKQLSHHDQVSLAKARARQIAHDQAELLADIEAIAEGVSAETAEQIDDPMMRDHVVFDTTAAEISAALSLTRRMSEIQTELAHQLRQRLPQVWAALSEGLIDLARARVLADQTTHLPGDLARQVCDRALERAPDQTTGQLRARIQRLIIQADPAAAKDRYEQKMGERKLVCEASDAGTANLYATDLPADRANAAMCRINRLAKTAKRKGDHRCIDLIRTDIFLDLLTGSHQDLTGSDRAVVDITVDLTTLVGLDEQPGEIPGWGPVISDIARQLAEQQPTAQYRYTVTDEEGQVVANGTTKRRPNQALKRLVEAKARTCVFPGCRMPARECDIDHNQAWIDGGATIECNLAPLCRHHHKLKHRGWTLQQTKPGTYTWTSPLGHTYTTGPDPP